jgi:hypothetical protein
MLLLLFLEIKISERTNPKGKNAKKKIKIELPPKIDGPVNKEIAL